MKRVPIIDFIRFGSIVAVIGSHFYPQWIVSFLQSPFLKQAVYIFLSNGLYGVTCFFVVSGFLITQMLVEGRSDLSRLDLKAFYVKRAARIFPLLLAVVAVGYTMEHFIFLADEHMRRYDPWGDETGFGWLFWLSLFTFSFNWYAIFHHAAHGGHWLVLWSLAVEEQFYFGYPWALRLLGNRRHIIGFLVLVVLFGLAFRYWLLPGFVENPFLMHQSSFGCFDQIALGGLLYFAHEKWGDQLSRSRITAWGLTLLGSLLALGTYFGTSTDNGVQYVAAPTVLALGVALLILGGMHCGSFDGLWARRSSWPGKLSYGCYVWHSSVLFFLMPSLIQMGGIWGLVLLVLAVHLFAALSYRAFETPVNRWVRSQFGLEPSERG